MPIGIKGIRINSLEIKCQAADDGEEKLSGNYSLISTTDKVLANQAFNSYGAMKLLPSPQTSKLLDDFIASYKADINAVLGLE